MNRFLRVLKCAVLAAVIVILTACGGAGDGGGNPGTTSAWASVSAGADHTLAIKTDGTLWAWGNNSYGQLGDGTTVDKYAPVRIGSATNWKSISAGGSHSIAVKTDGTLWAWGWNVFGQLGVGDNFDRTVPTQIGSATNWKSVSVGLFHSIALKTDGTLWAWGHNANYQLGVGTTVDKNAPVQIGSTTNWKTMFGGGYHTIAVKSDGTLWAWGSNYYGQLGVGDNFDRNSPTQVGITTNWVTASAGTYHTIAVTTYSGGGQELWAWGRNVAGQVGDGTTTDENAPVSIGYGPLFSWKVSAGGYHSTAIYGSGQPGENTFYIWGNNYYGQLGDGTTTDEHTPITVVGNDISTAFNWKSASAGYTHTLAIKTDGTLWAWGQNNYGQLGDGTTVDKHLPTNIP